ncbi:hypothetical protein AVEN_201932-1, partial [Araneus ventricosus]
VLFRQPGASEKSPNNVEFRQISYKHPLVDLARVWFTIGNIYARLMENRFALGDLARVWFTIGDICARLTECTFFLLAPIKPGGFGRKRHEFDSPNLGSHFPQNPAPAITFPSSTRKWAVVGKNNWFPLPHLSSKRSKNITSPQRSQPPQTALHRCYGGIFRPLGMSELRRDNTGVVNTSLHQMFTMFLKQHSFCCKHLVFSSKFVCLQQKF